MNLNLIDHEGIANEAKLHEIAKIIDSEFFLESIKEQIYDGLDGSSTDYLNEFNIKLRHVLNNYHEEEYSEVLEFRDELCRKIIEWFEDKYDVGITYDEEDLVKIATQLYTFFIKDLKDAMIQFLSAYIQEHYESIIKEIDESELNLKFVPEDKDKSDQLPYMVISNIGRVVDSVIDRNITFDEFIEYAARSGDIRSVVELHNGSDVLSIDDSEAMIRSIMKSLKEDEYDHNIIITVSELLISAFNIEKGAVEENYGQE